MKTIIAGGRNNSLTPKDYAYLDGIHITEVVSGCANGIDLCGQAYADSRNIPIKMFPAIWRPDGIYDGQAGFKRNEEMAGYAGAAVIFIGGKGTADMLQRALNHCLVVYDLTGRKL